MNTLRRGALGSLEERMLAANPLLESFGNAVTVRVALVGYFGYRSVPLFVRRF